MAQDIDIIGLHKAILWEEAKGKLRALVAASGSSPAGTGRTESWKEAGEFVESFIYTFEDKGLHE